MLKFKGLIITLRLQFLFWIVCLISGCAAMQTPQGGPRDTTPPKVLKMTPKDLTTNFNSKKIVLEFDEYIKLADESKEFSISPEQEKPPILKINGKKFEITLQDSLEKNTTYTLNFGKAITDINESNILKNFTYVFSTGATLDSLGVNGNVKNSLTGAPEIDAVVLLLPLAKDTIFGKKKPSIYTTTDSSGNYKLKNLKKGFYKIYTIKEQTGGDKIYQQFSDQVGFLKDPILLDKNLDSINMTIFKELAPTFRIIDRKLNNDGSISMNFNQLLRNPEISILEPASVNKDKKVQFNLTNDSVKVWLADLSFDSVKVVVKDEGQPLDTIKITRGKKDTYTRNIVSGDNLEGGMVNPIKNLKLNFNLPIEKIDINKIILLEDSIPRKGFTVEKDSSNLLSYLVKYPWKKNEKYILKIDDGAVSGIFGSKNKEITKKFILANPDDYGTLILTLQVPDSTKSYVLQVVNEKKDYVVSSQRITKNTVVTFLNYRTGIYYARIVYDENKNGKWDTGNVKEGRQPEKIIYEKKELSIKANWDRKEVIVIPPFK
jgi:hypothetical protein